MTEDEMILVEMSGQVGQVSMEELMGVDVSQFAEYRGTPAAPEGVAEWTVKDAGIERSEITDSETKEKTPVLRAYWKLEAIAYRSVKDRTIDPNSLVGLEHTERQMLRQIEIDVGRVNAFVHDVTGVPPTGSLLAVVQSCIGKEFVAPIKHNKGGYANIDRTAIKPLSATTAAAAAPAPSGGLAGFKLGGAAG